MNYFPHDLLFKDSETSWVLKLTQTYHLTQTLNHEVLVRRRLIPALVDYAGSLMRSSASSADLWPDLFCICLVMFQGQRERRGSTFLNLLHHSCQSSTLMECPTHAAFCRLRRLSLMTKTIHYKTAELLNNYPSYSTPFFLLYPELLTKASDVSWPPARMPLVNEYVTRILPLKQ